MRPSSSPCRHLATFAASVSLEHHIYITSINPQSNATTRVFAIPELLELILLGLADATTAIDEGHPLEPIATLCRVQRTSTASRATILGSPGIKILMQDAAPSSSDHRLDLALEWPFKTKFGLAVDLKYFADDSQNPYAKSSFKTLPPGIPSARSGSNLIHQRTTAFNTFKTR